jgi:hypothetical protein
MSLRFAVYFVTIMGAVGCTPPPQPKSNLPFVEHAGTISTSDLVAIFEDTCLKNFANHNAIRSAVLNQGFSLTAIDDPSGGPLWEIRNSRKGLEGMFGKVTIFDAGHFDICEVKAFVTEPGNIDRDRIAHLLAAGAAVTKRGKFFEIKRHSLDGREMSFWLDWPEVWSRWSSDKGERLERRQFGLSVRAEIVD